MRNSIAGLIGNILEHYSQALYGFLAPLLAPLFFPHSDPVVGLICAYALLPLGLIAKPIGALVFGRMGDRIGRAKTLSYTLLGMAATMAAIGCLPVHATVGWIAPLLLALACLLQNFFAAGETTGGALFLMEQVKKEKRGWISSLFDASSILGILIASAAALFWGEHWRLLFWGGTLSAIIGFILRKNVSFQSVPRQPWKDLWQEWRSILSIAAVIGFSYANYYLVTSFFNGFLPMVTHLNIQEALALNTFLLVLNLLLLPFFGWLTLRIAKERLMGAACLCSILFTLPFFLLLEGATIWMAAGVRLALVLIGICFAAPYHAWAMERCNPRLRFTICAMGFAIGSRLIGAPMPALSFWLYHQTHWVGSAALPIIAVGLLAGICLFKNRAPKTAPLNLNPNGKDALLIGQSQSHIESIV